MAFISIIQKSENLERFVGVAFWCVHNLLEMPAIRRSNETCVFVKWWAIRVVLFGLTLCNSTENIMRRLTSTATANDEYAVCRTLCSIRIDCVCVGDYNDTHTDTNRVRDHTADNPARQPVRCRSLSLYNHCSVHCFHCLRVVVCTITPIYLLKYLIFRLELKWFGDCCWS